MPSSVRRIQMRTNKFWERSSDRWPFQCAVTYTYNGQGVRTRAQCENNLKMKMIWKGCLNGLLSICDYFWSTNYWPPNAFGHILLVCPMEIILIVYLSIRSCRVIVRRIIDYLVTKSTFNLSQRICPSIETEHNLLCSVRKDEQLPPVLCLNARNHKWQTSPLVTLTWHLSTAFQYSNRPFLEITVVSRENAICSNSYLWLCDRPTSMEVYALACDGATKYHPVLQPIIRHIMH